MGPESNSRRVRRKHQVGHPAEKLNDKPDGNKNKR
jgi:hypothetical protein